MTNAVIHAKCGRDGGLILLALALSADLIHIEVTDTGHPSSKPYVPDGMPYEKESGRGLCIVREISKRRWGIRDHGVLGCTVWCDLDANPAPADSATPAASPYG